MQQMPFEDAGRIHAQNFALTGRLISIQKFKTGKQHFGFKIQLKVIFHLALETGFVSQQSVKRTTPYFTYRTHRI